jgi:hypothetical protein
MLLVLLANARLLYIAITSEPACVPHWRLGEGLPQPGHYRAAQSDCSASPADIGKERNKEQPQREPP